MEDEDGMETIREQPAWRRFLLKDGRLRPTLRVAFYPLWMFMNGLWLVFVPVIIISTTGIPQAWIEGPVGLVLTLIWVYTGTLLATRIIDKRSITELGLLGYRGLEWDLLIGLGVPLVLMGLLYLLGSGLGWYHSVEAAGRGTIVAALEMTQTVIFAILAALAVQGYMLRNLTDDWGQRPALLVSTLIFGLLLTLGVPGGNLLTFLTLSLLGLWMGLAAQATRALWMPIAIYASLTYTQGTLMGLPVQGHPVTGLVQTQVTGPELLTGGLLGLESGLLGAAVMLCGILLTLGWTRMRNRFTAAPVVAPYTAPAKKHR